MLLLMTLLKRVEKLTILPRCIFPFRSETNSQIIASVTKKILCEGRYDFRPAGLVSAISRNDIPSMKISAKRVIVRNRVFSMFM
jgi:hypothetical protein